ncbi:hypothetical protein QCA50_000979 [Cerrena zonata]|uniref:2OGFeDO JBP1/TET oxygenase domain-containing protein n=1 Tax=Cerrena zonata TaxID=2478898 RepID=A0AAW0H0C7_9APHY
MSWDVEKYVIECEKAGLRSGMSKGEDDILANFPPYDSEPRAITSPRTIVDCNGRIMAWVLPNVLPKRIQRAMGKSTSKLGAALHRKMSEKRGHTWRCNPQWFGEHMPRGVMDVSPAWFMVGWKGKLEGIRTSPFLATDQGQEWMRDSADAGAIISGMLRVMHPDQYRMAWEVMNRLRAVRPMEAMWCWPTVFNAVTIVANRQCPLHRDAEGMYRCYDILASVGEYESAPLYLSSLGIQIPNGPGTVVGFSGKALRHGVADAMGSHICHAYYVCESLREFLGVRPTAWMSQEMYRKWVGDTFQSQWFGMARDPFDL